VIKKSKQNERQIQRVLSLRQPIRPRVTSFSSGRDGRPSPRHPLNHLKTKLILLNPGPVNVTERVRKALLGPDICHRESEFSDLLARVRQKILKIFKIEKTHTLAFFTGSGTSALEAMLCSAAPENKKTLVLSNGVYGERLQSILKIHRKAFLALEAPVGKFPDFKTIETALRKDRSIEAVALVHHETSSGMLNPLKEVTRLAKKYKKLLFVDAISSLGAEPIDFKSIDFCAGTSGKCLHGFPGVSFVIIAKKVLGVLNQNHPRSLSLDLAQALANAEKNETAFTPAVQIFYALDEALDELTQEGLTRRIAGYRQKSLLIQKNMKELGVRFLVEKPSRSHVLTAFWLPDGISYQTLYDKLKKAGFVIYAGQSKLKDKIFRIANLGNVSLGDLRNFFNHFQQILKTTPPSRLRRATSPSQGEEMAKFPLLTKEGWPPTADGAVKT
jgi:2-aminoethylphosphonate-pyruvate transaminase